MSLWAEDTCVWITNRCDPTIRREYDRRRQELGLRYNEEMTEAQRKAFDREMVEKYSEVEPPPGRTTWLLRIWEMLDRNQAG